MNTKNPNRELAREAECKAMCDLGKDHGIDHHIIIRAIEENWSYIDFQKKVLSTIAARTKSERASFKEFSLTDWILSKANNKPHTKANASILSEYGRGEEVVPLSAFRTLSKTPDSAGGFTIDGRTAIYKLIDNSLSPCGNTSSSKRLCSHVESQVDLLPYQSKLTVIRSFRLGILRSWGIPNRKLQITFSEKKISGFYL